MNTLRLLFFLAALPGIGPATHAAPGDLDPLDANVAGLIGNSAVFATVEQPDGKLIIAGDFRSVLGVPRNNVARLNADGTLDMGFDSNANSAVYCVAVQADGKVLLGGEFTKLQPNGAATSSWRERIARVNADGTLDGSFNPRASDWVNCVAVQADGKILFAGACTFVRVNVDGTIDTGFNPPGADDCIQSVAVQADGKVLLGGRFTTLQPTGPGEAILRHFIARVHPDGTLDTGFDPNPNYIVDSVAVQADGKVLLGGGFTALQPNGASMATTRQHIARVNPDGTLDIGFDPSANATVASLAVQADGKVLLSGGFTTLQPNGSGVASTRQHIARVNPDGTLDTGFDPKADLWVNSVALQADGKVLLGGFFTSLQPNGVGTPTARNLIARLQNDPATHTVTVQGATVILWQRGGAGPELSGVTFEMSTDGGSSWTYLGMGARAGTTANWQFTGLKFPVGSQIRARGVTNGGNFNGSSGLIEQTVALLTADADHDGLLDSWELAHWPNTAGHSPADDFDHDGYNELLELALGLNPAVSDPGGLPPVINEGGFLTMTITKQPGVTYEVQSAGTVLPALPDSFSAANTTLLINDATTLKVRDNFLIGTPPSRFLRVKVTAAP